VGNRIDLSGKSAVVTGGAQGFGRAIAERFVASGARVALWDRDLPLAHRTAAELGVGGGDQAGAVAVACDVTDPAAVAAARDATLEQLGRIDILINNAGIAGVNASTWETDVEEWRKVMRINLDGPFLCSRAVVPHMIARGYGRIVNIASVAGKEGNPNAAPYSAAKAGVIALTKSLGKELASYDIAVNALTPSPAKTRILDQITDEQVKYMLGKVPRGRFVETAEAAAMVAWLVSADNSFTTAATFDLSGGRTTY
jgi:NAD(P)-dependent dehydrogenase (short-subunit alcohol dehydrogenase family)